MKTATPSTNQPIKAFYPRIRAISVWCELPPLVIYVAYTSEPFWRPSHLVHHLIGFEKTVEASGKFMARTCILILVLASINGFFTHDER